MSESYLKIKEDGTFTVGADKSEIKFKEIGRRGLPRHDGLDKAAGRAVYTRDISLPGMLYARVKRSPYARARILSMDSSKAEAMPGVHLVLRYDDPELKGRQLNGSVIGTVEMIQGNHADHVASKPIREILAENIYFEGQAAGAVVVADTEDIADEALRLIKIDWEELPFVLDQEEALKPDAPVLRPDKDNNLLELSSGSLDVGDVEKGFAEADKIIEFKARRHAHLWAGAEMPSTVVKWTGDQLEMWNHVQQPYMVKRLLAEQLDLPLNKISIHSVYQGCSFGERCNPSDFSINGMNTLAVIAARRVKKPVKLLFDRREKFYGESGDMMVSRFKVGTKLDGTITAVHLKNIFAVNPCTSGIDHFVENTRIPNLKLENQTADVSKAPAWWCRCEQLPNNFCFTLVFDHVAAELGMDPIELALKNDGVEGHDMTYLSEYKQKLGFPDRDSLRECVDAGKIAIDWDNKWHVPGEKRLPDGRMHGIAFTWSHQWDDVRGHGSAAIQIEGDGTVSIITQHSDIGVNPWTAYKQIVADEIGVPYEMVNIKPFNMDQGFALMSPDGSCNLTSNGYVMKKAARKARKMLLELATEKMGVPDIDRLEIEDGMVFDKENPENKKTFREIAFLTMPMANATGVWSEPPISSWSWHNQGLFGQATSTGRHRLCRQAHFIEIAIDTDTGAIEVLKVVNVNDVGKAISPETVEGQMYGGSFMGVGRSTMEEMIWDEPTGVLLNRNLLDYKYATMLDLGPVDAIFKETEMGHGPYGSVGVGEDVATVMPALLSPAVFNAIGLWIDDFPITPDKILTALGKVKN